LLVLYVVRGLDARCRYSKFVNGDTTELAKVLRSASAQTAERRGRCGGAQNE